MLSSLMLSSAVRSGGSGRVTVTPGLNQADGSSSRRSTTPHRA